MVFRWQNLRRWRRHSFKRFTVPERTVTSIVLELNVSKFDVFLTDATDRQTTLHQFNSKAANIKIWDKSSLHLLVPLFQKTDFRHSLTIKLIILIIFRIKSPKLIYIRHSLLSVFYFYFGHVFSAAFLQPTFVETTTTFGLNWSNYP